MYARDLVESINEYLAGGFFHKILYLVKLKKKRSIDIIGDEIPP